mmetsp:Transcript_19046/g.64220  ORF Transcript_19046/g.64220 Transcript_19046/m.64220 type:complete len:212 (+) Transcript_19046:877-1512(+)
MCSSRLSSSSRFSASNTSDWARLSSSSTTQYPCRTAAVSAPSRKTSLPCSSGAKAPMYSCTSVCSWLLMRSRTCPVAAASRSITDVFPAEVGPCRSRGYRAAATMRASWRKRASMEGVKMKRGSSADAVCRGSVCSQKPPISTQPSPDGRAGALAGGGRGGLFGLGGIRWRSTSASTCGWKRACSCATKVMWNPSYKQRCKPYPTGTAART